jgi:L,D-transpeptidase-like protein
MRKELGLTCVMLVGLVLPTHPPHPYPSTAKTASAKRPLPKTLDGISFAGEPGVLYLPIPEAIEALHLPARWDRRSRTLRFQNRRIRRSRFRSLVDSTPLISLRHLKHLGARVKWDWVRNVAVLTHGERQVWVRKGVKRIAVNRARQRLRAWQGDRLVLETRVSTGMASHRTPPGLFTAGPFKSPMHYSSLYNNAPMPWTVQVYGDVCIHGSTSVPGYPASHGCIRVPLTNGNPARWIYRWIDRGAAVVIRDRWPRAVAEERSESTG